MNHRLQLKLAIRPSTSQAGLASSSRRSRARLEELKAQGGVQ